MNSEERLTIFILIAIIILITSLTAPAVYDYYYPMLKDDNEAEVVEDPLLNNIHSYHSFMGAVDVWIDIDNGNGTVSWEGTISQKTITTNNDSIICVCSKLIDTVTVTGINLSITIEVRITLLDEQEKITFWGDGE